MLPLQKLNKESNYVHINSDHSPSIIKEFPISIGKRLSNYHDKCLESSGYKTKLKNQQQKESNQSGKKRKRNIICFNPPYSESVKTNIGGIFIKLIS